VKAATELALDAEDELLFHHSRRVYLWGTLKSRRRGRRPDAEIPHRPSVWLSIALHTTPGIPEHLSPEVHLVTLGVETDVLGRELYEITDEQRAAVTAAHPRPDFKNRIQHAFYDGMKDRPDTTFGTMNDDVLAHFDPHFDREDFVSGIMQSAWPE
jgi:hypothetical protein